MVNFDYIHWRIKAVRTNIFSFLRGKSSKFSPHAQKVSLAHAVQDEDVVSSEVSVPF